MYEFLDIQCDGNFGVLACNYYPQNGDMIIDTADNYYSNNPGTGTTNVLTHEIGHGVGLATRMSLLIKQN